MLNNLINEFKNKKIVILGFGKEGKSTYNFLRKYLGNISITISDFNENIKKDSLIQNDTNISFITGSAYLENLDQFDMIIKTPGISFKDINTQKIKAKIFSQLEFLLKYFKDNIIGITGTKGKSTTSSLIYDVLKNNDKDVLLLGNIGTPIFDFIDKINDDTLLVVEMSSHQLEFVNYSPKYAIITNFYEDHLDHTKSINEYYQSKLNIIKYQKNNDYLIYYEGCKTLDDYINKTPLENDILKVNFNNKDIITYCDDSDNYIYTNNEKIYDIKEPRNLIGRHNLINIMLVLTLSKLLNLDNNKTIKAINNFKPLEHRLELVGTIEDITYYNDSIATIPDATINGIESLKKVNTLIFGGLDRGINYDEFINYLYNSKVENLICMPTTGHKIAKKLQEMDTKKNIYLVETLEEAVIIAKKVTKKNTICLMSPAAASYNYFKNFEEKGKKFKELVNQK